MKKFFIVLLVFFSISLTAQEVQLPWKKDLNIAKAIAKSESKPILVYFTKNDCKACSAFYGDFFKSDTFKALAEDFVLLMLDGSNSDMKTTDWEIIKKRRMVNHYNKTMSFPAVLVLDSEGFEKGEPLVRTDAAAITDFYNYLQTLK